MPAPYPYQVEGIDRLQQILSKRGAALLADEMGLGKTGQAILAMDGLLKPGARVLVVCPASLKENWAAEIQLWLGEKATVYYGKSGKGCVTPPASGWHVVNYDVLHFPKLLRWARAHNWDALICDEAHAIKSPDTLRTKAVTSIPAHHRLFITGTPIASRPIEAQTFLSMIFPDNSWITDRWKFGKRYCNGHKGKYGWNDRGHSNLHELHGRLKPVMVRRLKKDVLKDLPDKTRQIIELPVPESVKRKVNIITGEVELTEETLGEIANAVDAAVDVGEEIGKSAKLGSSVKMTIATMSKLRKKLAEFKAPLVAAHVADMLKRGEAERVVVAYHHKETGKILADELKKTATIYKIDGSTPPKKRLSLVNNFNRDKGPAVMLGQITAAGVGLNMTGASVVVFAEMDWVPAAITQMEDRLHRIGQKDNVLVQFMCLADSLDTNIVHALTKKVKVIAKAVDGGGRDVRKEGARMPRRDELERMARAMSIRQKESAHLGVWELNKDKRWSAVHEPIGNRLSKSRRPTEAEYGIMLWLCYHYRARLSPELRERLPIAGNQEPQLTLGI